MASLLARFLPTPRTPVRPPHSPAFIQDSEAGQIQVQWLLSSQ